MAQLKLFWFFPDAKCPFCAHRKCGDCREVSESHLACCQCRKRAIKRLEALQEMLDIEKQNDR